MVKASWYTFCHIKEKPRRFGSGPEADCPPHLTHGSRSGREAFDPNVTRYLEDIEDHLNTFLEEAAVATREGQLRHVTTILADFTMKWQSFVEKLQGQAPTITPFLVVFERQREQQKGHP